MHLRAISIRKLIFLPAGLSLIMLLLPGAVLADTPAVVQSGTKTCLMTTSPNNTVTLSRAVTAGDTLVVVVGGQEYGGTAADVTGASDPVNGSWTKVGNTGSTTPDNGLHSVSEAVYEVANAKATSGSLAITVSFTAASNGTEPNGIAMEVNGSLDASSLQTTAPLTDSNNKITAPSGVANDLVLGLFSIYQPPNFSAGAGWAQVAKARGCSAAFAEAATPATAASPVVDATSSTTYAGASLSFTNGKYSHTVFSDGFESGDLRNWDSGTGSGSTTVNTSAAHSGVYGVQETNSQGQGSSLNKTLSDPAPDTTVDFWIYPTGSTGSQALAEARSSDGSLHLWGLLYDGANQRVNFFPYTNSGSTEIDTANGTVLRNQWNHIQVSYTEAAQANGGGATLYINGATQASWSVSGDYSRPAGLGRVQLENDSTSTTNFDDVKITTPPVSAPTAPSGAAGSAQDGNLALHWSTPSYDGGSPVTSYTITPYIGGVAQTPIQTGRAATSYLVTGLTNGTAYTFTVKATNSAGTSTESAASSALTPSSGSGSISSLLVSGNHFVDTHGNAINLHGADRSGSEYACQQGWGLNDGPMDQGSITAMKNWKINIVRIGINEDCWLGINGVSATYSGTNYQNAIINYVNLLHENGMYAEIVPMWGAPGTAVASYQTSMPDSDHTPDTWTSIGTAFKNDPTVILGTWGEPNVSYSCEMNGCNNEATFGSNQDGLGSCSPTCGASGYWYKAAGMSTGLTNYRNAGYNGPVAIPCAGYAEACANSDGSNYAGSTWWNSVPSDPKNSIVAEAHIYGGNTLCGNSITNGGSIDNCLNHSVKPILSGGTSGYPVIFGETGQDVASLDCTNTNNISDLINWADSNHVGYMPWTWTIAHDNNGNVACPSLISDYYNGTPANGFAQWIQTHYTTAW
jgi:endoglucanase